MKFGDALASMIGEFATMTRTPDARPKTGDSRVAPADGIPSSSSSNYNRFNRRHSLQLTVGVSGDVPPINVQRRGTTSNRRSSVATTTVEGLPERLSWWRSKGSKLRRQSEPILNPFDSFHKKLARLRQKQSLSGTEEEDDELDEKRDAENMPTNVKKNDKRKEVAKPLAKKPQEELEVEDTLKSQRGSIIVIGEEDADEVFKDTECEITRL